MSKPVGQVGARKPGGPKHEFVAHREPWMSRRRICAECGKHRGDKSHEPPEE
jgi:hypothetical protein